MDAKNDIFVQFKELGITPKLLSETNLLESEYENLFLRLKKLTQNKKHFLSITEAWQLTLLAGHLQDFEKYCDKKDNFDHNIVFYAVCSESIEVLEWIIDEKNNLIKNYAPANSHNVFLKDLKIITVFLKSIILLDWMLENQEINFLNDICLMNKFLEGIILFNWINALEKIHQTHPTIIETHAKFLINFSIKTKRIATFNWFAEYFTEQLMCQKFLIKSIRYGMLGGVNWFIKNAPPQMLEYTAHGINILLLACISASNRVFDRIIDIKKDLLQSVDQNGLGLIEYAFKSKSIYRINKILSLLGNPSKLDYKKNQPNEDFEGISCYVSDRALGRILNDVLDYNFYIQKVSPTFPLYVESVLKLKRNKMMNRIEQLKPIVYTLLLIRQEEHFPRLPFELIQIIILNILPQGIPEPTIHCYRQHFLFKNVNLLVEEEDSQTDVLDPHALSA